MSDAPPTPKLNVYIVVLAFHPAPLWVSSIFAPDRAAASALAMLQCIRACPEVGELASVNVIEAQTEWLRSALRISEGGPIEGAQVLSLVPAAPAKPEGQIQADFSAKPGGPQVEAVLAAEAAAKAAAETRSPPGGGWNPPDPYAA